MLGVRPALVQGWGMRGDGLSKVPALQGFMLGGAVQNTQMDQSSHTVDGGAIEVMGGAG